jgi:predicted metalloprotease with PDZ domain
MPLKIFACCVRLLLLILPYAFAPPGPAQATETAGQYRIRIPDDNPFRVFVEAEIPVKDGHLFMAPWGADHLPDGWATFVSSLKITDGAGRPLTFESKANGARQIADAFNGSVKLSYQVDLSFAKTKWKYGNEQAGIFQDGGLFVVSKALFIVSDLTGRRQLTFELPQSWKLSAPWLPEGTDPHVLMARSNDDLLNNSLVFGKYAEYSFSEGNFTFVLALLGSMEKSKDLVAPALQKIVRTYGRIFPKTPRSKYLMTIFYADEADAEAYASSAAFSERDQLTGSNLIRWGNTVAHEFFHSWNGHAISPEDYAGAQWFSEGFTEYFANLALVQQKLISKDLFMRKMEHNLGLYSLFKESPAFDNASLKEAGAKKGRYRIGVYNGGWATAFCFDVLIRAETGGRRSLEDFMRTMHEKFGLTGRKYRYEDLVATAGEIVGHDVSDFFKKYVEGKETLPFTDYLKRAGFEGYTQFYDGEVYVFEAATAGKQAATIRESILNGH